MSIGTRLKQARDTAELSQKALAELSGVTQQMISRLESGKAKATTDVVPLALALKVSPEWLATGEGRPAAARPVSPRALRLAEKFLALSTQRQELILRLIEELQSERR